VKASLTQTDTDIALDGHKFAEKKEQEGAAEGRHARSMA